MWFQGSAETDQVSPFLNLCHSMFGLLAQMLSDLMLVCHMHLNCISFSSQDAVPSFTASQSFKSILGDYDLQRIRTVYFVYSAQLH